MERDIQIYEQNNLVHPDVKSISPEAKTVLQYYEESIATPHVINLGSVTKLPQRYEGDTSPGALREYAVVYPPSLNNAYKIICEEHDTALMHIVDGHKEWITDYQLAPKSLAFQVDGPAFSDMFLMYAATVDSHVLAEFLKVKIFEVENNIAGYDLNSRLWPEGTTNATWQTMLEEVRKKTGRKIAVLASTEEKLRAMLASELGVTSYSDLPIEEKIRETTGFDAFWGPNELISHYQQYNGIESEYVFFGRTSRPTSWLKNPANHISEPFLVDSALRKYVRAFAITHNFDNSEYSLHDSRVITDTKEALSAIGAAYVINGPEDVYSAEFLQFLNDKKIPITNVVFQDELTDAKMKKIGKNIVNCYFNFPRVTMLAPQLYTHLEARGIDPYQVVNGFQKIRAKPLKRHYGAWGHIRSSLTASTFVDKLKNEVEQRGPFVLQPEMQNMEIIDPKTGISYLVIDRVFFVRGSDGELRRMEGIRAHMPKNSSEGQKNSVHDGQYTLDAPIKN